MGKETQSKRLLIFDLDGTLTDTRDIHFEALNKAIRQVAGEQYVITRAMHLSEFDGLSTIEKLIRLNGRGLAPGLNGVISDYKKVLTNTMLEESIKPSKKLIEMFKWLRQNEYWITVASNAIPATVKLCLKKLDIESYVNQTLSNADVNFTKPYPEMYWRAMMHFGVLPKDTLIIEDSAIGREGAFASGANVWALESMDELTLDNLKKRLEMKTTTDKTTKWHDRNMTVLIPMAGAGSRFADAGYIFPKPLIEVRGKPMIQAVTENLAINAKFVYIVQKSHYEKYNLQAVLNLISPGCKIIQTEGLTEGAACTTLLAKEFINNGDRLVIANSDQLVDWNANKTMYSLIESGVDGGILTFKSTHPKWSFAKLGDDGLVSEVAEKNPISDNATVGIYYWSKGSDYVKYAEQMIAKNVRVNNEFYVCPVFNQAIEDGKKIAIREVAGMHGIGTPQDLEYYLSNTK